MRTEGIIQVACRDGRKIFDLIGSADLTACVLYVCACVRRLLYPYSQTVIGP